MPTVATIQNYRWDGTITGAVNAFAREDADEAALGRAMKALECPNGRKKNAVGWSNTPRSFGVKRNDEGARLVYKVLSETKGLFRLKELSHKCGMQHGTCANILDRLLIEGLAEKVTIVAEDGSNRKRPAVFYKATGRDFEVRPPHDAEVVRRALAEMGEATSQQIAEVTGFTVRKIARQFSTLQALGIVKNTPGDKKKKRTVWSMVKP